MSQYDASLLTQDRPTAEFFEAVATKCNNPKSAANWLLGDVSASLNKAGIQLTESKLVAVELADLILRIDDGTLSSKMAKTVFDALWDGETNVDPVSYTHLTLPTILRV